MRTKSDDELEKLRRSEKLAETELGKMRRLILEKKNTRRPPFKPVPIESGLTEEDVASKEELADERLGNSLVEKSNKLDRILENTEMIVKLTRKIYVGLEKSKLEKRGDKE